MTGQKGAVVGSHRVRISALKEEFGEGDARRTGPPPRGGWPLADRVPRKYNADSKLTFDVPPGGTDAADFKLTSP